MFMALLETHHFTFYAFGFSKREVLAAMRKRWKQHQIRTGASFTFEELQDSIWVTRVEAGAFEVSEMKGV